MNVVFRRVIRASLGSKLVLPGGKVIDTYKPPIVLRALPKRVIHRKNCITVLPSLRPRTIIISRMPPDRTEEEQITFDGQAVAFA